MDPSYSLGDDFGRIVNGTVRRTTFPNMTAVQAEIDAFNSLPEKIDKNIWQQLAYELPCSH